MNSAFNSREIPKTKEEFSNFFNNDLWEQTNRIVLDTIENVQNNVSFFSASKIIDRAMQKAEGELSIDVLSHRYFKSLLEFHFENAHNYIQVGNSGQITTPEMWRAENELLRMGGEEVPDHILDEDLVDSYVGRRIWIPERDLPKEFAEKYRAFDPDPEGTGKRMLEMRQVVSFAKENGYDVFGVDLAWNREGASHLSNDFCGSVDEFIYAIEESQEKGENWFEKPTLFFGESWNSEQQKKLKELAKDSGQDVVFTGRIGISDEQTKAVEECVFSKKRASIIEGTAGAGKSFTMKTVYEAYRDSGYDVMGTALGWSAAKVLSGSTGMPSKNCRALKGLLMAIENSKAAGTDFFVRPTVIIVDEAGMVGTKQMHQLFQLTRSSKQPVKIILTGDSLQVAPVEAGNALEALVDKYGSVRIDTIRRQKQESHRIAVKRFSQRRSGEAIYPFLQQECVKWATNKENLFYQVVQNFLSYRVAHPENKALILAYTNDDVNELNRMIRDAYKKSGLIAADEVELEVTDSRKVWRAGFSIGDEVCLRSNDPSLPVYEIPTDPNASTFDSEEWTYKNVGVFNRNSGRIVDIKRAISPAGSYDFTIDLEGEEPGRVIINSKTFKADKKRGLPMVHNFATTIYGSQGMTVPKTFMIDHQMLNFRLSYVGMSRHTNSVEIYINETDMHHRLDRKMNKSVKVPKDWPKNKELPTQLGIYSRKQMLTAVAERWRAPADNLTAWLYDRRSKLEKVKDSRLENEAMSIVKMGSPNDPITDWKEYNQRYPLVDLERIFELPTPIGNSAFVRPSDAHDHRASLPSFESALLTDEKPLGVQDSVNSVRLPPKEEESDGLLLKAANWLRRVSGEAPVKIASQQEFNEKARLKVEQQEKQKIEERKSVPQFDPSEFDENNTDWVPKFDKPNAPFKPLTTQELIEEKNKELTISEKIGQFFGSSVPRPKGLHDLPMLPLPDLVGCVRDDTIVFQNVPQSLNADGSFKADPSKDFMTLPQTKLWWDIGLGGEPRVLARNTSGEVVARYSLDGKCVVGDGEPPLAYAPNPDHTTAIQIVPGPKEWFLLQEMYAEKFKETPEKVPHLIWAAQDMDWELASKFFKKKKIVIVRSKTDDSQIAWAQDLHRELKERWNLNVFVNPPLPIEDLENEAKNNQVNALESTEENKVPTGRFSKVKGP